MLKMEMQIKPMATALNQRGHGRFPSQSELNPQGLDHVKVIASLKRGTIINNQVVHLKAPLTTEIHDKDDQEDEILEDDAEASNKKKENEAT